MRNEAPPSDTSRTPSVHLARLQLNAERFLRQRRGRCFPAILCSLLDARPDLPVQRDLLARPLPTGNAVIEQLALLAHLSRAFVRDPLAGLERPIKVSSVLSPPGQLATRLPCAQAEGKYPSMRPTAIPTACPVDMPPFAALPAALLAFEALLLSALSTASVFECMTVTMTVEGVSKVVRVSGAIDVEVEELLLLLDGEVLLAVVSLVLLVVADVDETEDDDVGPRLEDVEDS